MSTSSIVRRKSSGRWASASSTTASKVAPDDEALRGLAGACSCRRRWPSCGRGHRAARGAVCGVRLMCVFRRIVSSQARGCRPSKRSMASEGPQQRVLHEVLGLGMVAGERVGDRGAAPRSPGPHGREALVGRDRARVKRQPHTLANPVRRLIHSSERRRAPTCVVEPHGRSLAQARSTTTSAGFIPSIESGSPARKWLVWPPSPTTQWEMSHQ